MERSRTPPPTTSSEDEVPSLPEVASYPEVASPPQVASPREELPALASLLEEVRAPGAGRAEVDALLEGLSQPLPPEHSPRERADLLLSLIGDEVIASYTGSDGRTVRGAAVQALISLGYPYALEVPPEALEATSREDEALGPGILSTSNGRWGFGLITLAALLQAIPVGYLGVAFEEQGIMALVLSIIFFVTLLPALLAIAGQNVGSRGLKKAGIVWLKVVACLWGALGVVSMTSFALALIPFLMAFLHFFGARLMDSKNEE